MTAIRRVRDDKPADRASHPAADTPARTSPPVLIFDAYHATFGGNQRYICMLLSEPQGNRWRFALACPGEGRLTEAARACGGEVYVVPQSARLERGRTALLASGAFDRIRTALDLLRFNLRFIAVLRRLRPAAVQVHSTRNALMVGLAARLTAVPMLLFIKGEMESPLFDRIAVRLARRTVFLSRYLAPPWMPRLGDAGIGVVPIGIEFERVDEAERRVGSGALPAVVIEPATVNFAFAGWLVPAKGVRVLIEAFAAVHRVAPQCRLHILGAASDDAFAAELQALATRLVPADTVRFLGWRDDVLDVLAAMDVFVMPSFSEGVPRSIVEAMALGKAVIGTRVGGIPELLDDGRLGLLADAGDVRELADAMVRLAVDAAFRAELGRLARIEARSRYSFADHVAALSAALGSVAPSATGNPQPLP